MDVRSLSALTVAWLLVAGGLVGSAWAIGTGEGWPFFGTVIVGLVGGVAIIILLWLRQTPIPPGDRGRYRSTVSAKLAAGASTGLVAFVLAVVVGPWWLSTLGAFFSVVALAVAWPSPADRERHELLYLV